MANIQHKNVDLTNQHVIHAWSYSDAATRIAASGFVSADIGKVALQTDTGSYWRLTATTPTWVQVNALLDEDDLASDSNEQSPTQQSVKAYITSQQLYDLKVANNLSDVASTTTSRANLGSTTVGDAVFTAATNLIAKQALKIGVKDSSIASASTLDLDTALLTKDSAHITGTVPITAVTLSAGRVFRAIANAALPLVHSTTLIVQGNSSYTCAVGDELLFYGDGSSIVYVWIRKANSSFPRNTISGFVVTNNSTTPNTKIDISEGEAADSSNTYLLKGASGGWTKDLSLTWAVGNGNGGYWTSGGLPVSSVLYAFAIRKDTDGSVDFYVDGSSTAANIPTGYTAFRRIFSFWTDSSGIIIKWKVTGTGKTLDVDQEKYFQALTGGTATTRTAVTVTAPPDSRVKVQFELIYGTAICYGWVQGTNFTDVSPVLTFSDANVRVDSTRAQIHKTVPVDSSRQIYYRLSSALSTANIITNGYILER